MGLKDILKKYQVNYYEDIPYFVINDYIFFYYKLKNTECFAVCINRPLIHKSDLSLINKKYKNIIKLKVDNIAYKNDLIYIYLHEFDDIDVKLKIVSEELSSLNYLNRNNCIVCGNKASLNKYKNILVNIDTDCIEKLNKEELDNINKSKTYFKKSLSSSIIASIICILPSIILSFLLGNYSIITAVLMFLPPFFSIIFFNKSPMNRTKKSDLIVFIVSFSSIILCHILIIILFSFLYQIKSLLTYFSAFNILIIESLIETILFYFIGYISGSFIVKKRVTIKLEKKKL